jgi:hypothetical protein
LKRMFRGSTARVRFARVFILRWLRTGEKTRSTDRSVCATSVRERKELEVALAGKNHGEETAVGRDIEFAD